MSKINALASEITKQLQTYTTEVEKRVKLAENKVTTQAVNELKQTSPQRDGGYAAGWAKKKTDQGIVIYNRNKPGLTHLLEKGYAKVNGGRVEGIIHIRPVEQKTIKSFEQEVEKAIRQ